MAFGDFHGLNPALFGVHGTKAEHDMEMAEDGVQRLCDKYGLDFAYISDTLTVENLQQEGYTLGQIANEEIPEDVFLDNAYPLD